MRLILCPDVHGYSILTHSLFLYHVVKLLQLACLRESRRQQLLLSRRRAQNARQESQFLWPAPLPVARHSSSLSPRKSQNQSPNRLPYRSLSPPHLRVCKPQYQQQYQQLQRPQSQQSNAAARSFERSTATATAAAAAAYGDVRPRAEYTQQQQQFWRRDSNSGSDRDQYEVATSVPRRPGTAPCHSHRHTYNSSGSNSSGSTNRAAAAQYTHVVTAVTNVNVTPQSPPLQQLQCTHDALLPAATTAAVAVDKELLTDSTAGSGSSSSSVNRPEKMPAAVRALSARVVRDVAAWTEELNRLQHATMHMAA